MKVEVRPATPLDLNALLDIERQCFNVPHYDYYVLDRRDFEQYLDDPECIFLVASLDPQSARDEAANPVGYILGPADLWREPPRAHVDSIGVLPEAQQKGVGSLLLRSFTSEARRRGCRRLTLEVSPANAAGMAFFARHGFREVRKLPDYYGRGLHGLLMRANIQDG